MYFLEIEVNSATVTKYKRLKKKNSQFSAHYNFMFELQKRLKTRVKHNAKTFKFRVHR